MQAENELWLAIKNYKCQMLQLKKQKESLELQEAIAWKQLYKLVGRKKNEDNSDA